MTKKHAKTTGTSMSRQRQKDAAKAKRASERHQHERAVTALSEARKTTMEESQSHPWPPPRQPTELRNQYRFYNPYNFVRYLPEPCITPGDSDSELLGRCPPPPHDRYLGLTGRITCTIEAVTPLFVSDSHEINEYPVANSPDKKHRSYRFFQYDGRDAIPASSLRGMIRAMFEAVTNSPFNVFNSDERLEYRIDPAEARRFKPGIVQSLPQDGRPGMIALCEEAKISAYYDDPESNRLDDSWTCGEAGWAIVGKTKNNVPKVEIISRNHAALAGDGRQVYRGWVKVTGRTIDSKRNESFFFFKGDPAKARTVHFDGDRESDLNTVLRAQLKEFKEDIQRRVQSEQLAPGNLVFVELEPEDNGWVRNIALARVARLRYRSAIGDLLPDHLKPSEHYDELDIASRVFGWVRASQSEERNERVAYAGRVQFNHATLVEDGDTGVYADELPLGILGEPKPTTTLFYLSSRSGKWSEEERKKPGTAETIGYDGPNELRGRKVYRHHGSALNRLEYERVDRRRDHQNRSVRGVRAPGNCFEFAINFQNLAPLELGALVWTLNLGDLGCHYRLGYAKPLGFGSVKLTVERVELIDLDRRYGSLDPEGWRAANPTERGIWLEQFETTMQRCYSRPIRQLENIRDLAILLREPEDSSRQHIHYPRTATKPDPEGKNFEWFVANKAKSTKLEIAGPNLTLEPPETEQGLPLLEKIKKS